MKGSAVTRGARSARRCCTSPSAAYAWSKWHPFDRVGGEETVRKCLLAECEDLLPVPALAFVGGFLIVVTPAARRFGSKKEFRGRFEFRVQGNVFDLRIGTDDKDGIDLMT
jgi:hypothetical protein